MTCGTAFILSAGKGDVRTTNFLHGSKCTKRVPTPTYAKRLRFGPKACDESVASDAAPADATKPTEDDSLSTSSSSSKSLEPTQSASEEYFNRLREMTRAETALSNPLGLKKSFEIVAIDEDGFGPRDRYVYVEERDCIGCTHCSTTATGTFFMESDYGRARVFDQTGDVEVCVEEAIDTCPVNCIYYVDWNDLVALENMREDQKINNKARLVGGQDFSSTRQGKTWTTVMDSGIIRCEDCPGRGCGTCPMYGVGENPEYLRQKALREAKKRGEGTTRRSKRTLM